MNRLHPVRLKFLSTLFGIIFLIFSFTSCSEDSTTEPVPTPSNLPLAKLSSIQEKVFNVSCATANCHAAGSAQANLVLSSGQSYSNLINVESLLFPGEKRVDEGNSSESIIIQLLTGQKTPQMPYNGTPLSQNVIDSIKKWIDDGALNN
jgi:hypothetical protein